MLKGTEHDSAAFDCLVLAWPDAKTALKNGFLGSRKQSTFFDFWNAKETQTVAQETKHHPKMASGGLLDGPWGAPVPQEGRRQHVLLHSEPFWASPGVWEGL